jgi:hypothetical protein
MNWIDEINFIINKKYIKCWEIDKIIRLCNRKENLLSLEIQKNHRLFEENKKKTLKLERIIKWNEENIIYLKKNIMNYEKELETKNQLIIKNKEESDNKILLIQNLLNAKYEKDVKDHKELEHWLINEDIKNLSNQNNKLKEESNKFKEEIDTLKKEITQLKEHMKDSDLPNKKRKFENIT